MQFLAPALLTWSVLLLVAVALYLFRRKPREVRVSTLPFFKSLARVYQESVWLRRLKRLISFLLTAMVILALALALAHPVASPAAGTLNSVILLVDGSASMAAEDASGQTRLERAKEILGERLPGVDRGAGVLVMRYDRRAEVLLPRTTDRRATLRALDQIEVRPMEGDADEAIHLAGRMAALGTPAVIWHVTDSPAGETPDLPDGVRLETINVSLDSLVNVGITAFKLRALPLEHGKLEAFVRIGASRVGQPPAGVDAAEPPLGVDATLEIRMQGALISLRQLTVPIGGSERLLIPIDSSLGDILTLKVVCEGDVLPTDDVVHARVPKMRPLKVLWVTEDPDPFTQLALAAISDAGELEAFQAAPTAWSSGEDFDVVLFDGWLPEVWPDDVGVIVLNPPGSKGPVRAARIEGQPLMVSKLRAVEDGHPVLFGIANDRVSLAQTAVLEAGGALTPLWVGPMGPILSAGEVSGQRLVVMAFSPQASESLPYMASYPLLLGNALLWLMQTEEDRRDGNSRRTGDVVFVDAGRDSDQETTILWEVPGTESVERVTGGPLVELDRLGLWSIGELKGSASLLSTRETELGAGVEVDSGAGRERGFSLRGDLRGYLLWLVLGVLLVESLLFHRLGVY